jgi:hypothetical protein
MPRIPAACDKHLIEITKKTSVKETSRKNVYGYDLADYRQIFIQKYNSLPPL